jgi:hypothetical protein
VYDARARYFRRLRRLRRSARRWSMLAGGFGGAAVVLVPYSGLGLVDAVWAAAAGGTAALTAWRWADARALAAQPPPEPVDPALAGEQARARLLATVRRFPAGRAALDEVRRQRTRLALRGSAAQPLWGRLERAAATLAGLAGRLTGAADAAVLEAAAAERSLRDLVERVAAVERAIGVSPLDARPALETAHQVLVDQLDGGVAAYERLVAAAAGYVAEDGRSATEHSATIRLTEATDLLRGVADGLAELRTPTDPLRAPG